MRAAAASLSSTHPAARCCRSGAHRRAGRGGGGGSAVRAAPASRGSTHAAARCCRIGQRVHFASATVSCRKSGPLGGFGLLEGPRAQHTSEPVSAWALACCCRTGSRQADTDPCRCSSAQKWLFGTLVCHARPTRLANTFDFAHHAHAQLNPAIDLHAGMKEQLPC